MCGIFGIFEEDKNKDNLFYDLGGLSESRGKEASGLMIIDGAEPVIKKYSSKFRNNRVAHSIYHFGTIFNNASMFRSRTDHKSSNILQKN